VEQRKQFLTFHEDICITKLDFLVCCRLEESDIVVRIVAQHKEKYQELQTALREASLEVVVCRDLGTDARYCNLMECAHGCSETKHRTPALQNQTFA
jgi:Tfp pilus assembly PilM family ATPase